MPKLEEIAISLIKEKSRYSIRDLDNYSNTIVNVGEIYRNNLIKIIKEINNSTKSKNFKVKVIDPFDKKEWFITS